MVSDAMKNFLRALVRAHIELEEEERTLIESPSGYTLGGTILDDLLIELCDMESRPTELVDYILSEFFEALKGNECFQRLIIVQEDIDILTRLHSALAGCWDEQDYINLRNWADLVESFHVLEWLEGLKPELFKGNWREPIPENPMAL